MARNIQSLFKITSNVFQIRNMQKICVNGSRTLYVASALGLDGYMKSREQTRIRFINMSDKFKEKMQNYLLDGPNSMVFTEDLKNLLHIVSDDPEDMKLLLKMMIKFNKQNKELRFGSFIFGPVVMRTYHHLNQVDEALAAFYHPELEGFFDQLMSYQILMDMLYNHGRYGVVRQVFDTVLRKQTPYQTVPYPRHLVTISFGACYKENTPVSFQYAMDLWQKLKSKDIIPMRKAAAFFAALALNQGKPDITLEVIFNIHKQNYTVPMNLKIAALAELNKLEDILPILKMSLTYDEPSHAKQTYVTEVINKVEKAIQNAGLSTNDPIVRVIEQLKESGHVVNTLLDSLIGQDIVGMRSQSGNRPDNHFTDRRNDYQQNNRNEYQPRNRQFGGSYKSNNNYNRRPGLKDLV